MDRSGKEAAGDRMRVLGIESTCDETAASIVVDGRCILSQVVSSQVNLHHIYGGVVPELACRRHMEVILPVIDEALKTASLSFQEIDLIAVARGPGLIGPLFIGLQTAKGLAIAHNKPLIGINHVEAHLYAPLMTAQKPPSFPAIGVVLSGGHTALVQIDAIGSYQVLGQTVDDAVGEAFDKVAKLLGLPYPGGPYVEALAKKGNPYRFPLKAGLTKENPLNFSFSGLKTAVMYTLKSLDASQEGERADLAASFQHAAFADILQKAEKAAHKIGTKTILLGGGVTQNEAIKTLFHQKFPNYDILFPAKDLSLDNASMIAGLGYHLFQLHGASDIRSLEAESRIPLSHFLINPTKDIMGSEGICEKAY
jgi:N6-L-threonylcarbamoyladenine synthase